MSYRNSIPRIIRQRPIAKKRRITEDVGASKAVELAISLLEDEFKLRERASEEFPPEISSSHFRSSIARYVDEVSVACDRSIYCSCGSYVSKGDIVGGVLRVFSHPARLVVRSPSQWRIRNTTTTFTTFDTIVLTLNRYP